MQHIKGASPSLPPIYHYANLFTHLDRMCDQLSWQQFKQTFFYQTEAERWSDECTDLLCLFIDSPYVRNRLRQLVHPSTMYHWVCYWNFQHFGLQQTNSIEIRNMVIARLANGLPAHTLLSDADNEAFAMHCMNAGNIAPYISWPFDEVGYMDMH